MHLSPHLYITVIGALGHTVGPNLKLHPEANIEYMASRKWLWSGLYYDRFQAFVNIGR